MPVWTANLILLAAGAVWGMGFIAQVGAMEHIGPMAFMALRFVLAGLCVLPFAVMELRRKSVAFDQPMFLTLLPVGLFFFISMALQQIGLLATSVTNAGFLTALYVVLVPLIMLTAFQERQNAIIWPAAALAFIGIFLLSGGEFSRLNWGDWLVIIGAFFAALHMIYVAKRAKATGTPVTLACFQFLITALFATAGYFVVEFVGIPEPALKLDLVMRAASEIIYAGMFAGALAFTLMAIGQQYTSPAAAAIFLSSESLFAALFGAWLLDERLSLLAYTGCAMIFCSLLMVELAPYFNRRPNRQTG